MTPSPDPQTSRRRYLFRGRVQGVFFRATSAEFARRHPIVGFVRNLSDGSVELEAEGGPDVIDGFIGEIRAHFAANITHVDATDLAPTGVESDFLIRY